eukprot:scaffold107100_cov67-Phaeocystis_antarctica.AAC.1
MKVLLRAGRRRRSTHSEPRDSRRALATDLATLVPVLPSDRATASTCAAAPSAAACMPPHRRLGRALAPPPHVAPVWDTRAATRHRWPHLPPQVILRVVEHQRDRAFAATRAH